MSVLVANRRTINCRKTESVLFSSLRQNMLQALLRILFQTYFGQMYTIIKVNWKQQARSIVIQGIQKWMPNILAHFISWLLILTTASLLVPGQNKAKTCTWNKPISIFQEFYIFLKFWKLPDQESNVVCISGQVLTTPTSQTVQVIW